MTAVRWRAVSPPTGFDVVWLLELRSIAELANVRARLRSELTGSPTVLQPQRELWSERLVLVVDELVSNALRHGRAPVSAALSRSGNQWMIAVSDHSADEPPVPAHGRDPGLGGFGLFLVADLASTHGWHTAAGMKVVWAVLTATRPGT